MNYWHEKQRADRLLADLQRAWDDFQEQVKQTEHLESLLDEWRETWNDRVDPSPRLLGETDEALTR